MKREVFERRFPQIDKSRFMDESLDSVKVSEAMGLYSMGLAPGGRMKQEIYEDPYDISDWDIAHGARCFVHISNSLVWIQVTGENPPTAPITASEYEKYELPWFRWYNDTIEALPGCEKLKNLKSVVALGKEKGDIPLPENQSVYQKWIVSLRDGLKENQIREYVDDAGYRGQEQRRA